LLSHKDKLMARDKGKFGKSAEAGEIIWYEYGRRQGLLRNGRKILLSPIVTKHTYKLIEAGLFLSGYCLVPKENANAKEILSALDDPSFREWVRLFGSPKQGGYYSLNKAAIEKYRY